MAKLGTSQAGTVVEDGDGDGGRVGPIVGTRVGMTAEEYTPVGADVGETVAAEKSESQRAARFAGHGGVSGASVGGELDRTLGTCVRDPVWSMNTTPSGSPLVRAALNEPSVCPTRATRSPDAAAATPIIQSDPFVPCWTVGAREAEGQFRGSQALTHTKRRIWPSKRSKDE